MYLGILFPWFGQSLMVFPSWDSRTPLVEEAAFLLHVFNYWTMVVDLVPQLKTACRDSQLGEKKLCLRFSK
jgi:hypothetical protein